jgi:hypothetical protein
MSEQWTEETRKRLIRFANADDYLKPVVAAALAELTRLHEAWDDGRAEYRVVWKLVEQLGIQSSGCPDSQIVEAFTRLREEHQGCDVSLLGHIDALNAAHERERVLREAADTVADGAACEFKDERLSYETWQLEPGSIEALRAALRSSEEPKP